FLSYGGTAAAAHLVAVGLVLGARRDALRRRLWTPPRWARRRPRLARALAVAMAAQLLVLGTLTWRLQASSGPALRELGQSQMTRCLPLWAPRGVVTDRHGTPLAENQATDLVRVTPRLLRRQPGGVERLAGLIGGEAPALGQQ